MAQQETPLPMPLTRWFADDANVLFLRDIVANQIFQRAQATLLDAAMPSMLGMPGEDSAKATRFAWLAGYRDAFRDLQKLTEIPPKPGEDDGHLEAWAHVTPPNRNLPEA